MPALPELEDLVPEEAARGVLAQVVEVRVRVVAAVLGVRPQAVVLSLWRSRKDQSRMCSPQNQVPRLRRALVSSLPLCTAIIPEMRLDSS